MKSIILVLTSLIILILTGCEKSNSDLNIESIIDTKWTLSKIIDNETGEISKFPEQIEQFAIVFRQNGKIDLPNYCNYSFGKYNLIRNDSLQIYDVGPGTEKYCLPDLSMDWEVLFINNLIASKTYSIEENHLTINCNSEYDLVFDFVEYYDSDKGKILFYTNSHILNCVFEIDISINEKSYSLSASSTYSDNDCQCNNSLNIGVLLKFERGSYDYTANELNCIASNKVNTWSGQVKVVSDSCTVIFLDINE